MIYTPKPQVIALLEGQDCGCESNRSSFYEFSNVHVGSQRVPFMSHFSCSKHKCYRFTWVRSSITMETKVSAILISAIGTFHPHHCYHPHTPPPTAPAVAHSLCGLHGHEHCGACETESNTCVNLRWSLYTDGGVKLGWK